MTFSSAPCARSPFKPPINPINYDFGAVSPFLLITISTRNHHKTFLNDHYSDKNYYRLQYTHEKSQSKQSQRETTQQGEEDKVNGKKLILGNCTVYSVALRWWVLDVCWNLRSGNRSDMYDIPGIIHRCTES